MRITTWKLPRDARLLCFGCEHLSTAVCESPHRCAWCHSAEVLWMAPPKIRNQRAGGGRK
jgi:hypothetical protein